MKHLRLPAVILAIIIIVALGFGAVNAQTSEPKIPNPTQEFYFNDFAKVLDPSTGSDIIKLGESEYKTTDGGQVVFVSIDTLDGYTIEEYANSLFNKWKIGTDDKGILFIISIKERKSRIEVGYGYEGILTDLESNKLLLKFSQLSKAEGMDEAVKTIYSDIIKIINGSEDAVKYSDTDEARGQTGSRGSFFAENPLKAIILGIILLVLVILDFSITGGEFTYFILSLVMASAGRGGRGGGNSGGGGRSGGGGSSSGF